MRDRVDVPAKAVSRREPPVMASVTAALDLPRQSAGTTSVIEGSMRAVVASRYGPIEVLEQRVVPTPQPGKGEVLVRVGAGALNPSDLHILKGQPFFLRFTGLGVLRPKHRIPGSDVAGRVEAVGSDVSELRPGDDVFGNLADFGRGAFAQYVAAPESAWIRMPRSTGYVEAAATPMAAVTALQGLKREGGIRPGMEVLINGASGGVGTFAVQIAKAFGATVTAVTSARNCALVRDLGADRVLDYTAEDFTNGDFRYDLIFDTIGNREVAEYERVLTDDGAFVTTHFLPALMFRKKGSGKRILRSMMATSSSEDLSFVRGLVESGQVRPVIDRRYELRDTIEALTYLEEGHARGKVVLEMSS